MMPVKALLLVTDREELIVPDSEEIDGLIFSVQELGQ